MPPRPRFSIVTAVYNVEPYLPDFIASIEGQRFDLDRVEVIVVDDGSTDGSLALLREWAERRPGLVTVVTKTNGGEASARNAGLERATGEWVTFTDPDDMLEPGFLAAADRFAARHPAVEAMASRPIMLYEASGRLVDDHPRRRQFSRGTRPVDLEVEPNVFTGSAAVSLFRLDRIRSQGLAFDLRVRPNFPDGHFAVLYLMGLAQPVVGLLADARYIYRKRAAGTSVVQLSWADPRRFGDVLEHGYLDVVARARARYGRLPAWIQHVLIYELSWYLSEDDKITTSIRMAPELRPRFHELLARIVQELDPDVVWAHRVRSLHAVWADILAYGCRTHDWHSPVAVRGDTDAAMQLQEIRYRFVGKPPVEAFQLDGAPVMPAYSKTMSHRYYGRALIHERVHWLPAGGSLEVRLDGRRVALRNGWPKPGRGRPERESAAERLVRILRMPEPALGRAIRRRTSAALRAVVRAAWRGVAHEWPFRVEFRNAWVLMDRIHDADDNAERLFEYLSAERPDINAWFVVDRESPDWPRLRAAGVTRLVAHGSFRWTMLMLNCVWLLSSHADEAIVRPPRIIRLLGRPTWKFAFLQHGIIKDDLAMWLNRKPIDLFVVSTEPELQSIVANGSSYRYSTKETRNTGLPRFDRLLQKGRQVRPADRDLVIIAPTWRTFLTPPIDPLTYRRLGPVNEAFWESDYLRRWRAVVESPEIAAAAARCSLRVAFMPHPNMQAVLDQMELPPHVLPLRFAGQDVQDLYARCAVLVTDYSSVAFNVAYLDGQVVYYQFDLDAYMSGGHMGRQGYFDYVRDGFGPVAFDHREAVAAIVGSIERAPLPAPEYQARIDRTFVNRDGRACARVVDAVEELSRPFVPRHRTGDETAAYGRSHAEAHAAMTSEQAT